MIREKEWAENSFEMVPPHENPRTSELDLNVKLFTKGFSNVSFNFNFKWIFSKTTIK